MDKDLVIADPRVSRDHALIVSENGQFFVVDQGSKHGTFINGERVERKLLERNDREQAAQVLGRLLRISRDKNDKTKAQQLLATIKAK